LKTTKYLTPTSPIKLQPRQWVSGFSYFPPDSPPIRAFQPPTSHISCIKTSSRMYFSAFHDIANSLHKVPYVNQVILRLHFEVEDSFFLHKSDVLYIRAMLGVANRRGRAFPSYTRNINLHISAVNRDRTIPREILALVERDQYFMHLVYSGYVRFTAEGHFVNTSRVVGPRIYLPMSTTIGETTSTFSN
jgi:hypothetical protein